MPDGRVPILMYHAISPQALPTFQKYSVTPESFTRQMNWLAFASYTPITLGRLLDCRAGREQLPPRPVIITFDDGYQKSARYAVPILSARGFTAVFYIVAGLVGKSTEWLRIERGLELPLMDWGEIRRLAGEGFEIGSHTLTHPRLTEIPEAECRRELGGARDLLEAELGREITHLAYPFGSFNSRVARLAAETGYRSAATVEIGFARGEMSPFGLARVPITGYDSLVDFVCRLRTGYRYGELIKNMVATPARALLRGDIS